MERFDCAARVFSSRKGDIVADQGEFDDFYLGTRLHLLRQLTVMIGDGDQAADVLQEAYARAWERWHQVSRLDQPMAWVRKVAWRLAVDQHRRSLFAADRLRRLFVSGAPADESSRADESLDLREALGCLSPEHRRALVLYEMCGLPVAQVAAETGVSEGTVKSRLARARAALSAALGQEYRVVGSTDAVREGGLS